MQVNTGGDPTSTLLQDCATDASKFFLLTSAGQIVTTFGQIGTVALETSAGDVTSHTAAPRNPDTGCLGAAAFCLKGQIRAFGQPHVNDAHNKLCGIRGILSK